MVSWRYQKSQSFTFLKSEGKEKKIIGWLYWFRFIPFVYRAIGKYCRLLQLPNDANSQYQLLLLRLLLLSLDLFICWLFLTDAEVIIHVKFVGQSHHIQLSFSTFWLFVYPLDWSSILSTLVICDFFCSESNRSQLQHRPRIKLIRWR